MIVVLQSARFVILGIASHINIAEVELYLEVLLLHVNFLIQNIVLEYASMVECYSVEDGVGKLFRLLVLEQRCADSVEHQQQTEPFRDILLNIDKKDYFLSL